ncbi:hypothetical protein SAMN05421828_1062 [Acidiphilium rubrum]|uniref:Uncharacterized protein n=2 Tax=Acidocellaceae TaxID=3385905 RepID=A0A8G2CJI7_ACIRU|nr:hypothetical protein SAMN05421828_1062 [Acidiphilium rubrum]
MQQRHLRPIRQNPPHRHLTPRPQLRPQHPMQPLRPTKPHRQISRIRSQMNNLKCHPTLYRNLVSEFFTLTKP